MSAPEQPLVPTPAVIIPESTPFRTADSPWETLRDLPLRVSVDIPLPPMSLRSLGALLPGQVLCSAVPTSEDLSIAIGGAPVSWARFESIDGRMAVRVTRLI